MSDIPDFWSSFVGYDFPTKFQKFVHPDKHSTVWAQTTGYYAHGYSYAFERLIMIAIDMWPKAEYLRMPTFYLARHSAELHLKEVIKEYSAANGVEYDAAGEHSLMALWNKVISQLMQAGWSTDGDEWTAYCGKLIQHLHDFDPNGQRFRYPESNDGLPFGGTRVELEKLAIAHASITSWCEGACDTLVASRA